MKNVLRIVLGIAVLIGSWMLKQKGQPSETEGTLLLFGNELAHSSLNLITLAFALIGAAMVLIGILGLRKQSARP